MNPLEKKQNNLDLFAAWTPSCLPAAASQMIYMVPCDGRHMFGRTQKCEMVFFFEEDTKKMSHIWFILRKTIDSTIKWQLDTRRHRKNYRRDLWSSSLFDCSSSTRAWKIHWNGSKGKRHMQMSLPHKTLKTAKTTRCLQRDLTTVERTLAGETPQTTQAYNPSPPK